MVRTYRHSIVTGGSSGIGKAIALQLAASGSHVSIVARGAERLRVAQLEIEKERVSTAQKVLTVSADVSDRTQAEQAITTAIERLGPPDLLVTSAGMARPGYFQELSADVFERTMAVNYFGTLYCVRAALPAMEEQQEGEICLISSAAGLIGIYGYSAYSPSKFAVRGLAETLRAELKPVGIRVAIAYPPDTDTPQLEEESKTKPPATKKITATAKLWQPEDVAIAILKGLGKKKLEISPGPETLVLTRLHSLISPILNRYFDSVIARSL